MSVDAEGTGRIVMELDYYTPYIPVVLTSDIWQHVSPGKSIWHDILIKFNSVHLEPEMIATLQLGFLLNIHIVESSPKFGVINIKNFI
jgi:hypothetical protein